MRVEHRTEIGSISKVVTAIVVHQLVDEGHLDLDTPVVDLLPWISFGEPEAPVAPRHLLSHTAGLVLGADAVPDQPAQLWAMRDLVRSGALGERWHYSNLGFMALGELACAVTGEDWATLVRTRVLEPLGAGAALPVITHQDRATMATGHWAPVDDRPWLPGDPVSAATWFEVASADGNIGASAPELGRLAAFLLGDGSPLLSPGSMQALVSPWAPTGEPVCLWGPTPGLTESRYGLGIKVETVDGHHCVTHGGGMVGYATFLLADRDAGIAVVVTTNANGEQPAAQVIARVAHRMLLDASYSPPSASAVVLADELPAALRGTFALVDDGGAHDESLDSVEVVADDDGQVRIVTAAGSGRLLRTWTDRFVTDHPDLALHPLTPGEGRWLHGPHVLTRGGGRAAALPEHLRALVGHYRSWSPWFTNLRIVGREGGLVLIAPSGVEAPMDDEPLVELGEGVFRVGADPWLPERLVAGPVVAGRCLTVVRDGCVYSRTFTE
jgi:CubicO group peptidase (beta-lactamase class C family)